MLQFIFKTLAAIFYKIEAQYTYTKLFKYLMKYKFIFLIYKPLKFIFYNLIYFIKLASAIIAILSLFYVSLLYYNFDVINEANDLINEIINWFRKLFYRWFPIEDDENIPDPVYFFQPKNRKDVKVIKKAVQQSSNNYWLIPVMLIGYGTVYYFIPNLNLEETINPVISQIESKIPSEYVTTFVTGTFIYKFLAISITYITGYKLTNDDSNSNDAPSNGNEINEDETLWRSSIRLPASYKPNNMRSEPQPIVYDPVANMSEDEQEEFNS